MTAGRWQRVELNFARVFAKAHELSVQQAATVGCRTLDILHVAAALALEVTEFFTFDHRQGELARRAGPTVRP